jgi:MFS family permease
LFVCYVAAYLDRVNIGFAKLQMLGSLGFDETVYGTGAGVFFLGYILFGLPASLAMRRVGAKVGIAAIMVAWGVLSGLVAFVDTPLQFFSLRFLLGVAESGFYPGVVLYLTRWFPDERRAGVLATFQSAVAFAGIVGGPVSGWALDHFDGCSHLRGWQWLFLIEAMPAIILGLAALACLHSDPRNAPWLDSNQKEFLTRSVADSLRAETVVGERNPFADGRIWALGILVFGLAMGLYAISFWMPTLLRNSGIFSATKIGWLSIIPNVAAAIVMNRFARSSDRRRERRGHVAMAAMLGSAGLAAGAVFSNHPTPALLGLVVALSGIMSALPMQWSLLSPFVTQSTATTAVAVVNSIGNLGGAVSPLLIGWLADATGSLSLGICTVSMVVAISALIAMRFPARLVNR